MSSLLNDSSDVLTETRKAVQAAAYQLKDHRSLVNQLTKEKQPTQVAEDDLLWAYFPPERTKSNQTKFRSFYVRQVEYQNDRIILHVRLTYEKNKNWFDLKIV